MADLFFKKAEDAGEQIDVAGVLAKGMYHKLFPSHLKIIPQINEIYELALAYYESRVLSSEEIVNNGAYFASVRGKLTRHFLMCTGDSLKLPDFSSSRLKSFFSSFQFKTGYATHGLFPYRGKFHPQMIKALINIMGIKPGETVLDPMMGSGTVPLECSLMGINSIGIDSNPFCSFMTQAKIDGLKIPIEPLNRAIENYQGLYDYFSRFSKKIDSEMKNSSCKVLRKDARPGQSQHPDLIGSADQQIWNFLLLAYLDGAGYAERSKRRAPLEQFKSVLERYVFAVKKIQRVLGSADGQLGVSMVQYGDARALPVKDCSVDGILFSPPYSFAIDYLKNDASHLYFLGVDHKVLQKRMVGLRGHGYREKYDLYIMDMEDVLAECARVLKAGRMCTMVVGTNDNQLGKALGVAREKVKGLHLVLAEIASSKGLKIIRSLSRQIVGMANTMRQEYIVIMQKLH